MKVFWQIATLCALTVIAGIVLLVNDRLIVGLVLALGGAVPLALTLKGMSAQRGPK